MSDFNPIRTLTVEEFSKEFCNGNPVQVVKNPNSGKFFLTHKGADKANPAVGKVSDKLQSSSAIQHIEEPMMALNPTSDGKGQVWSLYEGKSSNVVATFG